MKLTFPLILFVVVLFDQAPQLDNAEIHFQRGNLKHKNKDYNGAIEEYTYAVEKDPKFARAYFNRGSSKSNTRDYSGAVDDFTKAIELDPGYLKAYYHRAYLRNRLALHAEAAEDYTKVIQLNPEYIVAYYNRGLAYLYDENIEAACVDWEKALEMGYAKAQQKITQYCDK